MDDGKNGFESNINTNHMLGPFTKFKNFFPYLLSSTFLAKYGASVSLIIPKTNSIPKNDPKVDRMIVKIVPFIVPYALAITFKLNEIKIVNGSDGINASIKGKSTAESGANQILFNTNCCN